MNNNNKKNILSIISFVTIADRQQCYSTALVLLWPLNYLNPFLDRQRTVVTRCKTCRCCCCCFCCHRRLGDNNTTGSNCRDTSDRGSNDRCETGSHRCNTFQAWQKIKHSIYAILINILYTRIETYTTYFNLVNISIHWMVVMLLYLKYLNLSNLMIHLK